MLLSASVFPGIVHKIIFSEGHSFVRLLDADAQHILLYLRLSVPDNRVFINTRTDGVWGERTSLVLPKAGTPDRLSLSFKIESVLEIWNAHESLRFDRFDAATAEQVRYCILQNVSNQGDSLRLSVPRPEEMAAQISTQVAQRRMDMLERRLQTLCAPTPISEAL